MAQRKKVEVIFSQRAQKDLGEIYRYLSQYSPQALKKIDQKLFSLFKKLESFPLSGHCVPEFIGKKYREHRLLDYRVIYRHDEQKKKIFILTLRHGKRFLPRVP